jgi:hypothetical protein
MSFSCFTETDKTVIKQALIYQYDSDNALLNKCVQELNHYSPAQPPHTEILDNLAQCVNTITTTLDFLDRVHQARVGFAFELSDSENQCLRKAINAYIDRLIDEMFLPFDNYRNHVVIVDNCKSVLFSEEQFTAMRNEVKKQFNSLLYALTIKEQLC